MKNLLAAVDKAKDKTFETLLVSGGSNLTVPLPGGGVMFAGKLDSLGSSIKQGGLDISLPSAFSSNTDGLTPPVEGDELVFSALTIGDESATKLGGAAAVVLDLQWLAAGQKVRVEGLPEPVVFSLPITYNASKKLTCSYWDEESASWSSKGVRVSDQSVDGGPMFCETWHFSLFGAILEGATATILCANVDVFNMAALNEVFSSPWHSSLGGILFASIMYFFAFSFLVAACLDWHRARSFHWNDSYFLVLTAEPQPPGAASSQDEEDTVQVRTPLSPQEKILRSSALFAAILAAIYSCDSFKEALDDIASEWFTYFHEARSLLEQTCTGCEYEVVNCETTVIKEMSHRMISQLISHSSKHSAAAHLGLSGDLVAFVLEDKDLRQFLTTEIEHRLDEEAQSGELRAARSQRDSRAGFGTWRSTEDQFEAWMHMRDEICEVLLHHADKHKRHGVWPLIKSISRTFFFQNPVSELFVIDIFQTCKQRVAALTAEFLGALAFVALFFQGSGMVRRKGVATREICSGDQDSAGFRMGRFLVIASASLIIAGLPVILLRSLQTKRFKKIRGERGCKAWRRQLLTWKIQTILFWIVAVLYISSTGAYVVVFLANMSPDDDWSFTLTGVMSVSEDFLAFPLIWACLLPLLTKFWLCCHTFAHNVSHAEVVRQVSEALRSQSNMMLPIELV